MSTVTPVDREWSQESLVTHVAKAFQETPKTLADALATLQCLTACAEGRLTEELLAVFGSEFNKFTFDYYDMSFEVHGIAEGFACSSDHQERFWQLGFLRFWTHVHPEERRQPGERYYCKQLAKEPATAESEKE